MTRSVKKFAGPLLGIAIAFAMSAAVRFSMHPAGEGCPDAYYHVAIAEMGSDYYAGKIFPHMTMSIWSDNFYDKELGFHFLIEHARKVFGLAGFSGEAPFLLENAFFLAMIFFAFAACLAVFNIDHAWFYFIPLVALSPYFLFRLTLLRPHLLGIAVMLSSVAAFRFVKSPRQLFVPFFSGVVFSYCYSQPHFVLLPALAFGIASFREKKVMTLLFPLAALAGVLAGFAFHPQFPNTFLLWKIQCIDVPLKMLGGDAPVVLGDEMLKPSLSFYFQNMGVFALFAVDIASLAIGVKKFGWNFFDRHAYAISIVAGVSVFGLLFSYRPMEYACPFTVLMSGMILNRLPFPAADCELCRERGKIAKLAICLSVLVLSVFNVFYTISKFRSSDYMPHEDFACWVQEKKIPAGTIVANVNWSDFPQLFYSVPQFRFLFGIDPMFGYCHSPEKVEKLERFRTGHQKLVPDELREIVGARFVFVSRRGAPLAKDMFDWGFRIVYQGADGWLFDISPDPEK